MSPCSINTYSLMHCMLPLCTPSSQRVDGQQIIGERWWEAEKKNYSRQSNHYLWFKQYSFLYPTRSSHSHKETGHLTDNAISEKVKDLPMNCRRLLFIRMWVKALSTNIMRELLEGSEGGCLGGNLRPWAHPRARKDLNSFSSVSPDLT
jgi:hypothetical protein